MEIDGLKVWLTIEDKFTPLYKVKIRRSTNQSYATCYVASDVGKVGKVYCYVQMLIFVHFKRFCIHYEDLKADGRHARELDRDHVSLSKCTVSMDGVFDFFAEIILMIDHGQIL
jgi:hypothetical protein